MASVQTSSYEGRYLKLTVVEESTSISENKSVVKWTLESIGGSSKFYTIYNCKVVVNGQTVYNPGTVYWDDEKFPASKGFKSGTIDVAHKNDGTADDISFTLHGKVFYNGDENKSGTLSLSTIPRYASVSTSNSDITENSVKISWSSNSAISQVKYRLNGGNWVDVEDNVNKTSGTYTINNLSSNTNYTIDFDYKRKDSGLWSYSAGYSPGFSIKTYDYPYIQNYGTWKIGSNIPLKIYNPLRRSITYYIYGNDNSLICTSGPSDTSGDVSIGSNNEERIAQYQSIPNSKTGSYKVRMVVSSPSRDTTTGNGSYGIKDDGTEVPNFTSNNIIDIVDTLHTSITGDSTKFIQGHNKVSGKITPMSSNYYANLDYYSISASGVPTQTKNYSTSNISFEINNIATNQIKINAVDKRGLSKEATKSLTIIPYSNPTLSDSVITRQNGTGDHIILALSGKYTNWTGLNKNNGIQIFRYRYKVEGTSTWSSWKTQSGVVNTNGTWSINQLLDDIFNNTKRYNIQIEITDLLETIAFDGLLVSTANAMIWKDLQNKYVGIDKKPSKTLDVAGDINTDGALYVNGVKMIWYE